MHTTKAKKQLSNKCRRAAAATATAAAIVEREQPARKRDEHDTKHTQLLRVLKFNAVCMCVLMCVSVVVCVAHICSVSRSLFRFLPLPLSLFLDFRYAICG